ncbi:hypothetical protein PC41400_10410 [Paenibacillus chitinolyticus]|uniref:Uncharacterized protein n=1 Tax=Paenibacillus chitinolyticus TaxID=79263 RepID=A0A410WUA1_9BACL|nr:hypothetical protein PC41400_10410 [Paenibacillus chitinolyticus]
MVCMHGDRLQRFFAKNYMRSPRLLSFYRLEMSKIVVFYESVVNEIKSKAKKKRENKLMDFIIPLNSFAVYS